MKKILGIFRHADTPRNLLLMLNLELLALFVVIAFSVGAYVSENFYEINVGGKTVTTVTTMAKAKKAVKLINKEYQEKGAKDVKVSVEPAVEYQKVFYGKNDKKPELSSSKEAADTILGKDGSEALVAVTMDQTLKKEKDVKFETIVKESDEAALNTTGLAQKGEEGTEQLTIKTVSVNGEEVDSEVLERKVVEEPKDEVVVKGTLVEAGAQGTTNTKLGTAYSRAAGEQVAEFALKWVGNPYKWGGTSLTNGADCSGFVLAVYQHFGIGLPHDAGADRAYGVGVPLSEAQPGDLICYYGHIGIYIGNGQLVHAMNESHGITVSNIGYNGKPILTVRRILG